MKVYTSHLASSAKGAFNISGSLILLSLQGDSEQTMTDSRFLVFISTKFTTIFWAYYY